MGLSVVVISRHVSGLGRSSGELRAAAACGRRRGQLPVLVARWQPRSGLHTVCSLQVRSVTLQSEAHKAFYMCKTSESRIFISRRKNCSYLGLVE